MKKGSKLLLTAIFTISIAGYSTSMAQGEPKLSGTAYSVGLNYDSSAIKKDGYVYGIYGYMGVGFENMIEAALEQTHINYKNNLDDLDQTDFTMVFNNYSFYNTKIRLGFHYINSDDKYTDGGYTLILGLGKYQAYRWDANLDVYYTHYKDYVLKDGSKGLDVYQITPNIGFVWGNYNEIGKFYFKTSATYIRHSDDVGFGENFLSLEERVTYYRGPFTISGFVWLGERSFMVDNGGFTIYNLKEKYKHGYGVSATYTLTPQLSITAMAIKQQFEEEGNPNDVDIYTYGLQFGVFF